MELDIYANGLNVESFIHMLDNPTECYKFYWMDSILSLLSEGKNSMTFDEIINGMIADAWYSVSEYHLHLGPRDKYGKVLNSLERAVEKIQEVTELKNDAPRCEILQAVQEQSQHIKEEKNQMAKYVPYRVLASFLSEISGNDKIWEQRKRLIAYIDVMNKEKIFPYCIEDATGLKKKVVINSAWIKMFTDNMVPIKSWIQLKKIRYLQVRNPEVPGIVYKLEPENLKQRKLKYVRELWLSLMKMEKIRDIYSGEVIEEKHMDIDHFVPWSFVANDEIWNLIPMLDRLNSSKSNCLPKWEEYFKLFAKNQYLLYEKIYQYDKLMKKFESCQRDNLYSLWAKEELYKPGNDWDKFSNILETNLLPVYNAAKIQGYKMWRCF